jgi:hypothetical protein
MQRIKISSAQRATGSPGSYRIDLREVLEAGTYRLNEVFVCNSYYNVTSSNNTIYWEDTPGNTLSQTITPGIYTASQLAAAVATAITAHTATGSVFTGDYSAMTGKMSFTAAPVVVWSFTFDVDTANSIGSLIGFNGSEADPSAGGALQANVAPLLSFNINIGSATEVRDAKSNAYTYVIPVSEGPGSFILWNAKANYDQVAQLPRAMSLTIQVVDDDTNVIPLLLDGISFLSV